MEPMKKAQNLLAGQYANAFILVEDTDGNLFWEGSQIFGEGACRKFIREITEPDEFVISPDDEGE